MQPEDIQAIRKALANNPAAAGNFQLTTKDNNRWFCKFNDARKYPDLFATETRGLALLAAQNLFRIPKVIAATQMDETQLLVLEYIEEGPRTPAFWRRFGEQLALLHRITQPAFGLEFDNYMGLLPQNNTSTPGWITFFRDRRLQPQLELAADRGLLPGGLLPRFERLFARLPEFFPPEPPALLHGDLWSGNFLCDTESRPVLIDPAVHFGHRHMDLAMTKLFGGFEPAFYQAYHANYPFPPGYREQWEIANLYPLLVHVNIFGPRWLRHILPIMERF